MKQKFFLVILIMSMLSMSACSQATDFFQYQGEPEAQIESVNKAILSIDRIKTLNPVVSKDRDVYYLNKLFYRSLFTLDEGLMAKEDLAQSVVFEEAANVLTLQLKNDAKWSDGSPITLKDVQFTIEAYRKASFSDLTLYKNQVENMTQIRISGDSLLIRYNKKDEFCLEDLTFPILNEKSYKDINQALKADLNFIPITSGPYRIDSFNPYSQLIVSGNTYYKGTVPKNQIIFKIIPKENENMNLIDPNLITVAFSEKLTRDVDFSNLRVELSSFLSNEVEWLGFNTTRAPFNTKEMRQAIALAIDTKAILDYSYFGNGVLSDSLYYPEYWGTRNQGTLYDIDLKASSLLLGQMGYQDVDLDGILEDVNGKKLTVEILINQNDDSRKLAGEQIFQFLKEAGLDPVLKIVAGEEYQQALRTLNYDIYLGGARMGENYDLRPLLKSYVNNPVGYANKALDDYLDTLQSMKSREEKIKAYKSVEEILEKEIPYYPLVYKTYGVITSENFRGEVNPTFFNIYQGADTWSYQRTIPVVELSDFIKD